MVEIHFHAMGCEMAAFIDQEGSQAARALEQAPVWFEKWEQALSRFRPDSDLSQLNTSAGELYAAGRILWEVLQASLEAARWTGGLVTPTVLRSLERAGYDRSFEQLRPTQPGQISPTQAALMENSTTGLAGWGEIQVHENDHTILLPEGMKLDFGGIAKGWSAHQAMLRLMEFGPALVDASGDIAVSGLMSDGTPWPVDVADPLQVQQRLERLALDNCGVATSGVDFRRWQSGGAWKHHIIDPRTTEPAQTDLMSVTIIAPDALIAEAAAKAVLILGSQDGLDWLEDRPQLAGLMALQDGQLLYSREMQSYLGS